LTSGFSVWGQQICALSRGAAQIESLITGRVG
jgi:hypothetical protein